MRIIRHPKKKKLKGCAVALGTFDGVHRGHKEILTAAAKYAKKNRVASLAITFDPHPQQLIVPKRGLKLLTTLAEREELFCAAGIDGVVVFNFRKQLRKLSATDFIKKYLVDKLGVSSVFVGFDYAFGRGRAGNIEQLRALGKKHGFSVEVVPAIKVKKQIVKSRLIREYVSNGDFAQAINMLGHAYQLSGKVVSGSGRGNILGFPTANLEVADNKLIPAHGVYAGYWNKQKCVVNIGAPNFWH